eukprot:1161028-Pelagomonas_calceolata.AAC.5
MTHNSFFYQALIGVQEDLGENIFVNIVKIAKHLLRFAVELCSMLSAIPYGLNTATLAREARLAQKRSSSRPLTLKIPSKRFNFKPNHETLLLWGFLPCRSIPAFQGCGSGSSPSSLSDGQAPHSPTSGATSAPTNEEKSVADGDNQYGVVVDRGVHYGSQAREVLDAYVPLRFMQQQRKERLQQDVVQPTNLAPVVLFTHGGVWASGYGPQVTQDPSICVDFFKCCEYFA